MTGNYVVFAPMQGVYYAGVGKSPCSHYLYSRNIGGALIFRTFTDARFTAEQVFKDDRLAAGVYEVGLVGGCIEK